MRQAKLILAISETTKTDLVNYLGIPDSKIRVVYNMVSRAIFNKNLIPQDFDFCESDFVIYIGAADKHKNIQTLISAFAILDETIHLVILGGATTQLAELAKNQLRTRVHLIDNIDDSSYAFLLSKAATLVYPSLYEGFGLPVFEAAFARCPVVVSRRPAMIEFWSDNEVFYVNDPFDASEWANAISNVIDGPDLLKLNNSFEKASKYENMNVNQRILNILLSL